MVAIDRNKITGLCKYEWMTWGHDPQIKIICVCCSFWWTTLTTCVYWPIVNAGNASQVSDFIFYCHSYKLISIHVLHTLASEQTNQEDEQAKRQVWATFTTTTTSIAIITISVPSSGSSCSKYKVWRTGEKQLLDSTTLHTIVLQQIVKTSAP